MIPLKSAAGHYDSGDFPALLKKALTPRTEGLNKRKREARRRLRGTPSGCFSVTAPANKEMGGILSTPTAVTIRTGTLDYTGPASPFAQS